MIEAVPGGASAALEGPLGITSHIRVVKGPRQPVVRRLGLRVVRLASSLSPALALRIAQRMFFVPARHLPREREAEILDRADRGWIEFGGRRLALWRWGRGPIVLLAHGWCGYGGQFGAFVEPLVAAGFTALAWDAPGHGESEGRRTSLMEFGALVGHLARREGGVHAVIGHSLGASATGLACADGAPIGRVVLVGGAANPGGFFRWFLGVIGFSDVRSAEAMLEVERAHGFRWDDTNVAARAVSLGHVSALVIHDRDDAEVPFNNGIRISEGWPGARFVATEGLGHRRILRDAGVVAAAIRFVR